MKPRGLQTLALPLFLFLEVFMCTSVHANGTMIQADQAVATAGYFKLSWQAGASSATDANTSFVVQQSHSADFHTSQVLYKGMESSSLISGQPDGVYYYRVRETNQSAWSKPVRVEVRHHSLSTALQFFGLGFAVFALTLFTILRGVKQTRQE